MITVSIIVPCYNSQNTINRCIDSVIEQTVIDKEVIVIDDGSIDSSAEIIDVYAENHENIISIHKKNEGVCVARNVGIDISDSKYITFCDSDDYYKTTLLEKVYPCIQQKKADVVFWGVENPNPFIPQKNGDYCINDSDSRYKFLLQKAKGNRGRWEVWAGIFNSEIIKKYDIRFNVNCHNFAEDLGFELIFLLYANNIVTLEDGLYVYTENDNSMMSRSKRILHFHDLSEISHDVYLRFCNRLINYDFSPIHHEIISKEYCSLKNTDSLKDLIIWKKMYATDEHYNFLRQNDQAYYKQHLKNERKKRIVDKQEYLAAKCMAELGIVDYYFAKKWLKIMKYLSDKTNSVFNLVLNYKKSEYVHKKR